MSLLLRHNDENHELGNVKRVQHRHVAWATWFLRRNCRAYDRYAHIRERTLMGLLLPVVVSVLIEGGAAVCCDGLDASEFLGYSNAQLNYFALMGLVRRLRVIGGATTEIQQFAASGAWRASRFLEAT